MSATNYFKAGRAIVPFEESSTGAIRLAYTMAASLARRLRAPVAVCYPVPLRGQWSDVPAVLDRSGVAFAKPLAWAPRAGEGWCE